MGKTTEVAIVGGGAAGCAVAYYLARAGVKSTIVEREGVGSQASGYSAGGLNPLEGTGIPGPLGPLAIESFRMHTELRNRLVSESGVNFQYQLISKVSLALNESDVSDLLETMKVFEAKQGFSAHWVDGEDVHHLEPRLTDAIIGGLYTYGNAALNSYLYTTALSKAAQSLGAEVHSGEVTGLTRSGDRVTGVRLERGHMACDSVVLATGPWSQRAGAWLGFPVPVEPLKGEILRLRVSGPHLEYDFTWDHVSLFHRLDGLVWVGTTEEPRGFETHPTESVRRKLLEGATELMPAIADASLVKHTACLRPVTPDWLPIIGLAPGWDNVYLATGAGKKGILISPGIGKAIADLVTGGETDLPIAPFSAGRFAEARA